MSQCALSIFPPFMLLLLGLCLREAHGAESLARALSLILDFSLLPSTACQSPWRSTSLLKRLSD